ncbi:MAG TPA: hypothetical protein VGE74_17695 [Gemmata sp.]
MTETEWLACNHPDDMLPFLQGVVSDRKLRLVACEACRDLFGLLSRLAPGAVPDDEVVWSGLHAAERFLETRLRPGELEAVSSLVYAHSNSKRWLEYAIASTARPSAWEACDQTFMGLRDFADEVGWYLPGPVPEMDGAGFWDGVRQAALLRDVFGNPFRPAAFAPEWRTDTVVALAAQMYETRSFEAMPILGDALQDAGCDSDEVLSHCRGPGPHVRGCFVADLALGRT